MSQFNLWIDGGIIIVYLIVTIALGLWMRRFVRNVDDYLVAGRKVDLYLGIASLSATEFGIVTCMANAQLGYNYGFAGISPGIALFFAMFVVGKTGFCIRPLRQSEVITIPELFDQKFGRRVRWAGGLVIVLGGLLNMGVFLRMAGDFLTAVIGIPPGYLELLMTILLVVVVAYTLLGGMLSVLVTDYLQFIVMGVGLIAVTLLFLFQIGWNPVTEHLARELGPAAFNPFHGGAYGIERVILDLLIAFAVVLTWQTMISRVLAAKDTETGLKIYTWTAPFFLVRFALPAFIGVCALYFLAQTGHTIEDSIMAMPEFIALAVPVGLMGILIAAMLAADMSTNSSYLLAWSSVIYNDLLYPIHKGNWSSNKALSVNRWLIAGIGLFLLLYGLWYPLKGDLWVYLQVTGTIYLSSISVLLIAACYWPKANDWGALAAIFVGSIIPILFLLMQELESTKALAEKVGPYRSAIATYIFTALAMWIGSLIKPKIADA